MFHVCPVSCRLFPLSASVANAHAFQSFSSTLLTPTPSIFGVRRPPNKTELGALPYLAPACESGTRRHLVAWCFASCGLCSSPSPWGARPRRSSWCAVTLTASTDALSSGAVRPPRWLGKRRRRQEARERRAHDGKHGVQQHEERQALARDRVPASGCACRLLHAQAQGQLSRGADTILGSKRKMLALSSDLEGQRSALLSVIQPRKLLAPRGAPRSHELARGGASPRRRDS